MEARVYTPCNPALLPGDSGVHRLSALSEMYKVNGLRQHRCDQCGDYFTAENDGTLVFDPCPPKGICCTCNLRNKTLADDPADDENRTDDENPTDDENRTDDENETNDKDGYRLLAHKADDLYHLLCSSDHNMLPRMLEQGLNMARRSQTLSRRVVWPVADVFCPDFQGEVFFGADEASAVQDFTTTCTSKVACPIFEDWEGSVVLKFCRHVWRVLLEGLELTTNVHDLREVGQRIQFEIPPDAIDSTLVANLCEVTSNVGWMAALAEVDLYALAIMHVAANHTKPGDAKNKKRVVLLPILQPSNGKYYLILAECQLPDGPDVLTAQQLHTKCDFTSHPDMQEKLQCISTKLNECLATLLRRAISDRFPDMPEEVLHVTAEGLAQTATQQATGNHSGVVLSDRTNMSPMDIATALLALTVTMLSDITAVPSESQIPNFVGHLRSERQVKSLRELCDLYGIDTKSLGTLSRTKTHEKRSWCPVCLEYTVVTLRQHLRCADEPDVLVQRCVGKCRHGVDANGDARVIGFAELFNCGPSVDATQVASDLNAEECEPIFVVVQLAPTGPLHVRVVAAPHRLGGLRDSLHEKMKTEGWNPQSDTQHANIYTNGSAYSIASKADYDAMSPCFMGVEARCGSAAVDVGSDPNATILNKVHVPGTTSIGNILAHTAQLNCKRTTHFYSEPSALGRVMLPAILHQPMQNDRSSDLLADVADM